LGFPVPADCVQLQSFTGHHLRERAAQEQAFTVGRFEKQSVVGRPDFDASTLLTAGRAGMGFETGESFSVHVGWSGNSVVSAEKTPYTQGILGGGEILFGGEVSLGEGETYRTPWVYGSFGNGLDQAAGRFHEYLRSVHPRLRKIPRPVILNTWEAVYFNQSEKKLMALADVASKCGIERFVVDDGWFDGRRDDTTSLGDWQTDKTVWPQGLKPLADHVHSLGMQFGLWFEPEMISLNSKIARLHPEWIVKPSRNRLPMQGRHQQVLDLTNPAAYKYVYDAMAMLVDELSIDYIKWDHNRFVTEAVSPQNGRPCVHKQTLAVYSLFSQLKESFPELEIETCSSGGGRIDMGILALADRVWVSDCVDPVERIDIQRYTSLLVPPEMMGDHIGASPAHSTGRATSLQMRAATAFFGHLGVEWDLTKVSNDDLVALRQWVDEYKLRRDLFASGRLVHADTADPAVRVDGMVSHDKKTAIFRFTQLTTSTAYPAAFVRLPGLDATSLYEVRPLKINQGLEEIGNGQSELQWWNEKGVVLPGGVLASFGIRPPQLNPEEAVLFEVNEKAAR
jgi:alpha-galactosidase